MLSIFEKAFLKGYAAAELSVPTIFVCIGFTALIAIFICTIYKMVHKNSFFDRSFHLSLFALSVITAAIILTIQSNIVVSLGMVGALSIVRFRTAIKNPMDLVFLFWSISVGIICGAGFALIAIIASVVLTIGIILFSAIPSERETLLLVVDSTENNEEEIMKAVEEQCRTWKVRARNISSGNMNLAIEIKSKAPQELVKSISSMEKVTSVSLVEHDGDVTA